jgi:hypothetical protein
MNNQWMGVDAALDYLRQHSDGNVLPLLDLSHCEPPGLIMLSLPPLSKVETVETVAAYIRLRIDPLFRPQRLTADRVLVIHTTNLQHQEMVTNGARAAIEGIANLLAWVVISADRAASLVRSLREYAQKHNTAHLSAYIDLFSMDHPWEAALALLVACVQEKAGLGDSSVVAGLSRGRYLCLSRLAQWLGSVPHATLFAIIGMVTSDEHIGRCVPFASAWERTMRFATLARSARSIDLDGVLDRIRRIAGGGRDDSRPYDSMSYYVNQSDPGSPSWQSYDTCLRDADRRLRDAVGIWT